MPSAFSFTALTPHTLGLVLSWVNLILASVVGIDLALGNRRILPLSSITPATGQLPRVSIVIAARNEATTIEPALRSVLQLDYPNREIIVVNDRSTDDTGKILDRLAVEHPELRVVHLTSLPPDWIGKNHAIFEGTLRSTGEFLLLTDADVVMEPTTLRRAVAYVATHQLDHLTLFPRILAPSWALDLCVGTFAIFFNSYFKPWRAKIPGSSSFIGIGAFNFIRRTAYQQAGTHQAVRMRPDEDVKLGKRIKLAGLRQDILTGGDRVEVEWYPSVPAFIRGLEKNLFAGIDYRLVPMLLSCATVFTFGVWPPFGLLLGTGAIRLVYAGVILVFCWLYADNARFLRVGNPWLGILFPLGCVVYLAALLNSTAKTLYHGGIYWRETYYPLDKLKANQVE